MRGRRIRRKLIQEHGSHRVSKRIKVSCYIKMATTTTKTNSRINSCSMTVLNIRACIDKYHKSLAVIRNLISTAIGSRWVHPLMKWHRKVFRLSAMKIPLSQSKMDSQSHRVHFIDRISHPLKLRNKNWISDAWILRAVNWHTEYHHRHGHRWIWTVFK